MDRKAAVRLGEEIKQDVRVLVNRLRLECDCYKQALREIAKRNALVKSTDEDGNNYSTWCSQCYEIINIAKSANNVQCWRRSDGESF